jgi:hypothetical protein
MTAGLMKLPENHNAAQVQTLVNSIAQAISSYKVSTGRTTL